MARGKTNELGNFEGKDVLQTTVAVTNAGDGLSKAMGIDPEIIHQGDTGYLVLEWTCEKVRFEPIKDTETLARVHILRAGTATMIDGDLVGEAIKLQAEKIQAAEDERQGRLTFAQQLRSDHTMGEHAKGKVESCTMCEDETAAEEAEAGS